jgi:hypothetical protein
MVINQMAHGRAGECSYTGHRRRRAHRMVLRITSPITIRGLCIDLQSGNLWSVDEEWQQANYSRCCEGRHLVTSFVEMKLGSLRGRTRQRRVQLGNEEQERLDPRIFSASTQ